MNLYDISEVLPYIDFYIKFLICWTPCFSMENLGRKIGRFLYTAAQNYWTTLIEVLCKDVGWLWYQ